MNVLGEALQEIDNQEAQKAFDADIQARKDELHSYLRGWLAKSMQARRKNYEDRWNRWRQNSRNIYDPQKKARKEKWQSALFVPITMQNKEIIKSQLFRTLVSGLPYSIRPRPSGTQDEAKDVKDLVVREMERSKLEVVINDFLDDLTIYGTGFIKLFWENKFKRRSQRVPIYEPMTPETMARMEMTGQPPQVVGYQKMPAVPTLVYRGVSAWAVSIWDLFFVDGTKSLQSDPHAQRYRISFQEILDGIAQGFYFPEAAYKLKDVDEGDQVPQDKQREAADFARSIIPPSRTINERPHTVYEWYGPLPKKWLYVRPDDQHLIDNPDELVPAKCLFANEVLIAVDENEDYCGESPFESTGYLHVPGSVYHIGVAEMLEQIQDTMNEDTNQRKDNVQLILNRMFAILERSIVSRADLVSRPGGAIRIKSNSTDDVNKAIQWLETPDVTQSSYVETAHLERFAQELTGANRVTIGSGGTDARDVTQTKGGMELLKQSSTDRLMYYAMVIESDFITRMIRKFYSLIYQNIQPEEILQVLGPERAQYFQLRTPEEIERDNRLAPEGVFSTMHQPVRIAQWQAFRDQFAGAMFFDDQHMAQILGRAIELPDLDKIIVPMRDPVTGQPIPFPMMQQLSMLAQAQAGAPQPPGGPGKAGAATTKPRIPTKKAGENTPIQTPGPNGGQ